MSSNLVSSNLVSSKSVSTILRKTLYCIRHGTAQHNVLYNEFGSKVFYNPKYVDTHLVDKGFRQALELKRTWTNLKDVELVVVSPLMRTLQTADTIFKGTNIPMIALECVREYPMGKQTCNKRSDKDDLLRLFPYVDFRDLQTNEDQLWDPLREETIPELNMRINKLLSFLHTRPENVIALVNHSSFIGQFKDKEIKYLDNGQEELKHCYPYEVEI